MNNLVFERLKYISLKEIIKSINSQTNESLGNDGVTE